VQGGGAQGRVQGGEQGGAKCRKMNQRHMPCSPRWGRWTKLHYFTVLTGKTIWLRNICSVLSRTNSSDSAIWIMRV
jgi:hypothetical protein